jgi:DNA-binding transcriptional LysR family regulator
MDLEAKPLQYFAAVARETSFSRAAARLNISQPSLSAQVRELERRLGFQLFLRTSRHVELTREGRLFLPQALRMIAEAARMNRAAREIRANELRVGAAIYTVLIPERVRLTDEFARDHPHVALLVSNRDQGRLFIDLRRGDIDLALVIGLAARTVQDVGAVAGAPSEIVLPADVQRLGLLEKPVELLVPRMSALAGLDHIPLSALAGMKIAMLGSYHGGELIEAIAGPLESAGAELIVPPEGNAIAVERYGRVMGIPAISIGWFRCAEDPGAADVVRRPVEGLNVATELAVIRQGRGEHRPAAQAFWNHAAKMAPRLALPGLTP